MTDLRCIRTPACTSSPHNKLRLNHTRNCAEFTARLDNIRAMSESHVRTLKAAADAVYGEERLAVALGIRLEDLQRWMRNEGDPPLQVILDAFDIIEKGHRRTRRGSY